MFKQLKECLIITSVLSYYYINKETMFKTDTSDSIVAAVVFQLVLDGHWYLFAYFSKTMTLTEYNYKIYDKEILVIICAFKQ